MRPRRIMVIGCSGAGKSTFARALARELDLPLVHLDAEYWLPGWAQPTRDAWRAKLAAIVARKAWVLDGNYASAFDISMPRADIIVFLDLPLHVSLRGILWRPLRHWGRQRPDMAPGCIERYDWPFFKYVWQFREKQRPRIIDGLARFAKHAKLVHLRTRRKVRAVLADPAKLPFLKAA